MRPHRQPIPVWVIADEEERRFLAEAGVELTCIERGYEGPAYQMELAPTSLVAIIEAPTDKKNERNSRRISLPSRRRFFGPRTFDLDDVIIEPHAPYFKRQFRKTKLGQVRYRTDLTTVEYHKEGKPSKRCKRCKLLQSRLNWRVIGKGRSRRVVRYDPYTDLVGCSQHVRTVEKEVPHPEAGRVFSTFSFEKLLGQTPGTEIVFEVNGKWFRATIQEYTWWTERQQAEKTKKAQVAEAADKLWRQKAVSNAGRRARYRHRRYMAQPTRYELMMDDD